MRSRIPLAVCVVLAVLVGSSAFGTNTARATVAGQDTSTLDDQVELSLTVYNSDLALVRDVRNVELAPGTSDLRFMDIAATVNPATVHFRSLTQPPRVHVVRCGSSRVRKRWSRARSRPLADRMLAPLSRRSASDEVCRAQRQRAKLVCRVQLVRTSMHA